MWHWSNDAENAALTTGINYTLIPVYSHRGPLISILIGIIFHNIAVCFYIFNLMNAALVSRRVFKKPQKKKKKH